MYIKAIFYSIKNVLLATIVILLGIIIDWFVRFSISLMAFWINEVKGILTIYQRVLMLLGGVMISYDIFPKWLQSIGKILPPNYIVNLPAKLCVSPTINGFKQLLFSQLFYITVKTEFVFYID